MMTPKVKRRTFFRSSLSEILPAGNLIRVLANPMEEKRRAAIDGLKLSSCTAYIAKSVKKMLLDMENAVLIIDRRNRFLSLRTAQRELEALILWMGCSNSKEGFFFPLKAMHLLNKISPMRENKAEMRKS